jgi:GT2 family glycosyltransferase
VGAIVPPERIRLGVVVLTMGNRPAEVAAQLASVNAQQGPPLRVVVVGQGVPVPELPADRHRFEGLELPENRGIPVGRNAALERLREHGDVDAVVYLDDDGLVPDPSVADGVRAAFAADPGLGIIGFRIADETGHTQRRHVPRLRAKDPLRGGEVTTFLGGGNAVRMAVAEETGGWPDQFWFTHEETDVAWRALDAGWRIKYLPELVLQHPRTSPARHDVYFRMTARNRVWLARRHLPAPLVPLYLGTWIAVTVLRRPPGAGLRAWFAGFAEGWRKPCGGRRPIRWRTVWRMTRLGRPPVI